MGTVKAERKLKLGEESNSISIELQGGWYHSLCTSASRPRPPIKAYFSWGKSFYELFGQRCGKKCQSVVAKLTMAMVT